MPVLEIEMENIPNEILLKIFKSLSIRDQGTVTQVCKRFLTIMYYGNTTVYPKCKGCQKILRWYYHGFVNRYDYLKDKSKKVLEMEIPKCKECGYIVENDMVENIPMKVRGNLGIIKIESKKIPGFSELIKQFKQSLENHNGNLISIGSNTKIVYVPRDFSELPFSRFEKIHMSLSFSCWGCKKMVGVDLGEAFLNPTFLDEKQALSYLDNGKYFEFFTYVSSCNPLRLQCFRCDPNREDKIFRYALHQKVWVLSSLSLTCLRCHRRYNMKRGEISWALHCKDCDPSNEYMKFRWRNGWKVKKIKYFNVITQEYLWVSPKIFPRI